MGPDQKLFAGAYNLAVATIASSLRVLVEKPHPTVHKILPFGTVRQFDHHYLKIIIKRVIHSPNTTPE
jgi:hypothetical protein